MHIQYLAGFMDGEGSFYYNLRNRPNRSPVVAVSAIIANRNISVLKLIQSSYGGSIYEVRNKHTEIFRLEIFNRTELQRFCADLKDYLIIKKRHAELIEDFCQKYPSGKRNRYQPQDLMVMQEIRLLNSTQRFSVKN